MTSRRTTGEGGEERGFCDGEALSVPVETVWNRGEGCGCCVMGLATQPSARGRRWATLRDQCRWDRTGREALEAAEAHLLHRLRRCRIGPLRSTLCTKLSSRAAVKLSKTSISKLLFVRVQLYASHFGARRSASHLLL